VNLFEVNFIDTSGLTALVAALIALFLLDIRISEQAFSW
jgi:anti-anti-sigma regulatory factor